MSEPARVPCLTPGCQNTIQPVTAARNQGYCGPCAARRAKAAHDAYVKANRREVDRFAGVTDPVKLLQLMHTPPKYDPLVRLLPSPQTMEELYTSLTFGEARRLMTWVMQNLGDDNFVDEVARNLACLTDHPLDEMLESWLNHRLAYPHIIFRGASPRVRERLIASLDAGIGSLEVNHTLSSLAWIGDATVTEFFRRATSEPPAWTTGLHVGPAEYARQAGWELTPTGRRELTFSSCVALKAVASGEPDDRDVAIMQPRDGTCRSCRNPLRNLLTMSTTNAPLSAWSDLGPHVEVMTCQLCACYAPIHAKLDTAGRGVWSEKNQPPDFLPGNVELSENPWTNTPIRLQSRRPIRAADWSPITHTQIGGYPTWVQDSEYLACHDCGRTMMFLAQIDLDDVSSEGVYYAFVCAPCRTTATTYQQT